MGNVSFGDCVRDENELSVHPGKVRLQNHYVVKTCDFYTEVSPPKLRMPLHLYYFFHLYHSTG